MGILSRRAAELKGKGTAVREAGYNEEAIFAGRASNLDACLSRMKLINQSHHQWPIKKRKETCSFTSILVLNRFSV